MKPGHILYLLLFFTGAAITGCKKQSTDLPLGVSAKINGVQWKAAEFVCQKGSTTTFASDTETYIQIRGLPAGSNGGYPTGEAVFLTIYNYTGTTGVFIIDASTFGRYFNTPVNEAATSGTITITKVTDNGVQGTFSFNTPDYTITDGQFNVYTN